MGGRSSFLIVILVFGMLFSFFYLSDIIPVQPKIAIVIIPQDAVLESSGKNFEPQVITIVIGINNTVRWINQDSIPSSVMADSDAAFINATHDSSGNPTEESFLLPGESFQYTFTKPGEFGYHSVPHPQLKGTVIVLAAR